MHKFRLLRADEIECRIATVNPKGVTILLYKDARCDMNILDETVGAMNWQKSYSRENANCTVSLWDEAKAQWISKEDTGTESFTEKEKGLASDSFKRACFNWGIGRELYTAPRIFIPAETKEKPGAVIKEKSTGTYTCYDRFEVKQIAYDDASKICYLLITKNGAPVFDYGCPSLTEIKGLLQSYGVPEEYITISLGIDDMRDLTKTDALMIYDNIEGVAAKYKKAMEVK